MNFFTLCFNKNKLKESEKLIMDERTVFQSQQEMEKCCTSTQKTVGYLEKRGKLKFINSWKKYWFVLEGHLLLYYSSKDDYDSLSPCKGSITLVPSCSVKPYTACPATFQIMTRSSPITLRAESVGEQTKWMQAIMTTLNQNNNKSPTKLNHFRYSMERVNLIMNEKQTPSSSVINNNDNEGKEKAILERLQKLGARSYSETFTSFNLDVNAKSPTTKQREQEEDVDVDYGEKKEVARKLSKEISLIGEYYSCDNDIYEAPRRNSKHSEIEKFKTEKLEHQIDNDLYETYNADVFENEIYISNKPSLDLNRNEEDLYAKPLKKAPSQRRESTEHEIFFECENDLYATTDELLYDEPLDKEDDTSYEEISIRESLSELNIHDGVVNEGNISVNIYEDPTEIIFTNKKIKKKSRKLCRHFIQKLLQKQRNNGDNKKSGNCDLKKTLAMLTEIQELLEKKKEILREFSQNVKQCNEDGYEDKAETSSLQHHHNAEICNGIDCEEIYSEILTSERSSKELKEFLGNYFKRDGNVVVINSSEVPTT